MCSTLTPYSTNTNTLPPSPVVDEVILDVASGAELRNPELRAKKLESIERQVRVCVWTGVDGCVGWGGLWGGGS